MVAPDVEEHADIHGQVVAALVLEALAGHLHDHGEATLARVVQVAPQLGRLGCGVVALKALDAVVGVDGAHDAGAAARLAAVQDGADHVGDARLALGARDAHDLHVAVGAAPGKRGHDGHGAADVGRCQVRHARRGLGQRGLGRVLAQVGHRACLERAREEGGAKGSALAHEDVSGMHVARVVGGAADSCALVAKGASEQVGVLQGVCEPRESDGIHGNNATLLMPARDVRFWAIGAVASAGALHAQGRGFESLIAHHVYCGPRKRACAVFRR